MCVPQVDGGLYLLEAACKSNMNDEGKTTNVAPSVQRERLNHEVMNFSDVLSHSLEVAYVCCFTKR